MFYDMALLVDEQVSSGDIRMLGCISLSVPSH